MLEQQFHETRLREIDRRLAEIDSSLNREGPYLVQPGGGRNGKAFEQRPQPPEHPDPLGDGSGNPAGFHPQRKEHEDDVGRLFADRTSDHGSYFFRRGIAGSV